MTRRILNWPEKLTELIDARRARPFEWGSNDCCLFACDVILELTGIDPAADLRGTYSSELSAVRLLSQLGGVAGIATARCEANGFPEWPDPAFAQRGDVVLRDSPEHGPTLGICIGSSVAFVGEQGLVFIKLSDCLRAWRIT